MAKSPANSGGGRRRGRKEEGEDYIHNRSQRSRIVGQDLIVDLQCSSTMLNRLLAILRKFRGKNRLSEETQFCPTITETPQISVENVSPETDPRRFPVSECETQEMTFNLALGFGLFSLIAASKTELDKAIELRKEMEGILRSIQEEQQSNGASSKLSDSRVAYDANNTLDGLSNVGPYSIDDHASSFRSIQKERFLERMNRLEEELAVELELLQLHMETDSSSQYHKATEMSSNDTTSQSINDSSGEVIDIQHGNETQYYGVPPLELERRLHKLLQTRQEERIKELEAHLECLKQRLHEKEAEATWWKETAKLISDQVPDSPPVL